MEGDKLIFFIRYKQREEVVELSEYNTVEDLKLEIQRMFNVEMTKQDIVGWSATPASDQYILRTCATDEINNLVVTESISISFDTDPDIRYSNTEASAMDDNQTESMSISSDTDPDIRYSNTEASAMDDNQTDFIEFLELKAIRRLKEHLPQDFPITFHTMCFSDVLTYWSDFNEKKALLLYVHNSKDIFSRAFLKHVYNKELMSIIKNTCFVIGWDVEDNRLHKALIRALNHNAKLSTMSHLIMDKVGSAICLLPEDNDISIICCLRGNVSESSLISSFENVQQVCYNYNVKNMIDTSTDPELAAISSLQKKLPSDICVTIRQCSLNDAINSICTAPIDERKALLLYLHNSEQPFSQMFSQSLKNETVSAILKKHCLLIGWDVENSDYHDALKSALRCHPGLEYMSDFVSKKVAFASIILPVNNTITTFTCLRGTMTLKALIANLKQVEIALKTAIEEENELIAIENRTSSEDDMTPKKLQKMWADLLGDRDYDAFYFNEHELLKEKIAFALMVPVTDNGYDLKYQEKIDSLYEVIKEQSRLIAEFKDHIEIAFVFNCLVPLNEEKIEKAKNDANYCPKSDMSPVPVFILRKCRNESGNPCRIFIDINERVYNSWDNYLTENKHSKCRMIFPRNGRYQVGDNNILEERMSPACGLDVTALKVTDSVATVAGMASGAIAITASIAALPVVAPGIVIGAGVAGVSAGVWAIGRSVYSLNDRATHSETMSVTNSEARAAYLTLIAGTLGFCGVGSNALISHLVSRGAKIGQVGAFAANTIGVLNISAGGVSVINSGYEICDQWINGEEGPSTLAWLQFTSSVLFFGHAVYSFRGAQTIIEETQTKVLQEYENSLRSNRHRKTFNKLVRQTMRNHSDGASGKAEVIATIRNIENKNEVFAALTRNQKRLTKSGIRYSAGDGKITFNGMAVDMNEFIGLNPKQSEVFFNNLAQDVTNNQPNSPSNSSGGNVTLTNAVNNLLRTIQIEPSQVDIINLVRLVSDLLSFCSEPVRNQVVKAVELSVKFIMNRLPNDIIEFIDKIIPKNSQLSEYFRIGISFFSQKVDEMEKNYERFQKTGEEKYNNPLFGILNPVKAKRIVQMFEFIVKNSYSGERLCSAVLDEMSKFISAWISRKLFEYTEKAVKEEQRTAHSASYKPEILNCKICGGKYFNNS